MLYQGQWLELKEEFFKNDTDQLIRWETIHKHGSNVCVIIIARLLPSERLVLIRQFRPALNKIMLGFPAGMMDTDASIEEAALREFKEETGYIGQIENTSMPTNINGGIMNMQAYFIKVTVDETLPQNQTPIQELEMEEEIEVVLQHKSTLKQFLKSEYESGVDISSILWCMAETF